MSVAPTPLQERFEAASARMLDAHPEDRPGRMLRAPALTTGGAVYAFGTADEVIVKLPAARVAALIEAGDGSPCDPAGGRPMRQWVCLVPADEDACMQALAEARAFVAG